MTKTFHFAIACLFGLTVFGCDSKKSESTESTSSTLKAVSTDNAPTASKDSSNNAAPEKPKAPAIEASKIPSDLKGDAFDYYGLGRTDPIVMKVVQDGKDNGPGTQTVTLSIVGADFAEYTVSNTGSLSNLGEAVLRLDKKGIKVLTLKGQSPGDDNYELLNGVTVGKSWPFKLQSDQIKISGVNKVSGTESVKTAVGTDKDAIVVTVTASGTEQGNQVKLTSKTWLVKGRGQVKTEITNVSGKTKQTITMEESK